MERWISTRLNGCRVFPHSLLLLFGRTADEVVDEMDDLISMSNELGESLGRTYEVPDSMVSYFKSLMAS